MRVDDVGRVAQQLVGNVAGDLEQRCIPFEVREAQQRNARLTRAEFASKYPSKSWVRNFAAR